MPTFYQTSGGTVKKDSYDCGFTTVWRAKDKGTRIRIAAIGKAIVECGGVKYSKSARGVLASRIKKGKTYEARLKIAKTKSKGATTDCTGFAGACMYGAMHPMLLNGWMPNSSSLCSTPDGTFAHYKKLNYKKQLKARTLQRGDIVAKPNHHGAVVAESMSGINEKEYFFKNYYKDGSKKKKNPTVEKIKKHIKHYKSKIKKKKKKSKKALKKYYDKVKRERTTIYNKWKKVKNKKNKTTADRKYQKKLKDLLKKLDEKVIPAAKKAYENYKSPKKRPKKKTSKKTNSTTNNYTNYDEGISDGDKYDTEYTETEVVDLEPVITPEKVDWYYVRSGLNYFSEEDVYDSKNQQVRHKDYIGNIYCKRKLKVPTLNVTSNYWEFDFDMPFSSCSSYPANINRVEMVGGDPTTWRYYLNTNKLGQVQGGA